MSDTHLHGGQGEWPPAPIARWGVVALVPIRVQVPNYLSLLSGGIATR